MIKISELGITQQKLRNVVQLSEMIQFVKMGGVFTTDSIAAYHLKTEGSDGYVDLIEIVRFEDGRLFLRNGHHRAVAIFLAGRDKILDGEYHITDWKYSDFEDINLVRGWVTPFNVRTEVRLPDLAQFKDLVRRTYSELGRDAAIRLIHEKQKLYCEGKQVEGIAALANTVKM